jgi:hypothetical protein
MTPIRYSDMSSEAWIEASRSSSLIEGSMALVIARDQPRISASSPDGMPSISEITTSGSGNAKSSIRSVSPFSARRSRD